MLAEASRNASSWPRTSQRIASRNVSAALCVEVNLQAGCWGGAGMGAAVGIHVCWLDGGADEVPSGEAEQAAQAFHALGMQQRNAVHGNA